MDCTINRYQLSAITFFTYNLTAWKNGVGIPSTVDTKFPTVFILILIKKRKKEL